MDGLNQVLQQQLLDHFQGKIEIDQPRSPMGWFFGTIEKARNGKFVPTLGVAVAERRDICAQEAAAKESAKRAAVGAEKRKSELQARLDELDESQVRELLATSTDVEMSQVDDWLRSGRPTTGPVPASARVAINRRK